MDIKVEETDEEFCTKVKLESDNLGIEMRDEYLLEHENSDAFGECSPNQHGTSVYGISRTYINSGAKISSMPRFVDQFSRSNPEFFEGNFSTQESMNIQVEEPVFCVEVKLENDVADLEIDSRYILKNGENIEIFSKCLPSQLLKCKNTPLSEETDGQNIPVSCVKEGPATSVHERRQENETNGLFSSDETPRRNRKTTTWTRKEIFLLIGEYKTRECLWDRSLNEYKDKHVRMRHMQEIADILQKDPTDVNNKWQNLRSQFNAETRKMSMPHNGASSTHSYNSKWEYYNPMKFLQSGNSITQGISTIDMPVQNVAAIPSGEQEVIRKNLKRKPKNIEIDKDRRREILNTALEVMQRPVDSEQIFADFIADELRKRRGRKGDILRKKIQRLLLESDESENEYLS